MYGLLYKEKISALKRVYFNALMHAVNVRLERYVFQLMLSSRIVSLSFHVYINTLK